MIFAYRSTLKASGNSLPPKGQLLAWIIEIVLFCSRTGLGLLGEAGGQHPPQGPTLAPRSQPRLPGPRQSGGSGGTQRRQDQHHTGENTKNSLLHGSLCKFAKNTRELPVRKCSIGSTTLLKDCLIRRDSIFNFLLEWCFIVNVNVHTYIMIVTASKNLIFVLLLLTESSWL